MYATPIPADELESALRVIYGFFVYAKLSGYGEVCKGHIVDDYPHRIGLHIDGPADGIRNLFRQLPLLLDVSALQQMDLHYRHVAIPPLLMSFAPTCGHLCLFILHAFGGFA